MTTNRSRLGLPLALVLVVAPAVARAAEASCSDGVDDDGNGFTDCEDIDCAFVVSCLSFDSDGDGFTNETDCAPADPLLWGGAIGPVTGLRGRHGVGSSATFWWDDLSAVPGPTTTYDVATGELRDLRSRRATVPGASLLASVSAPTATDARRVLDWGTRGGDGYWYLVRAADGCGHGPFENPDLDPDAPWDTTTADCVACPNTVAALWPVRIEEQYVDGTVDTSACTACYRVNANSGETYDFHTCYTGAPGGVDTIIRVRNSACTLFTSNDNSNSTCGAGSGGSMVRFTATFTGTVLVCVSRFPSATWPSQTFRLAWRRL